METTRQAKDYYENLRANPSFGSSTRPTTAARLSGRDGHMFARGLGWMSLGLGAVELWKNEQLSESLGTGGEGRIFQFYGVREIATGIGLLTAKNPMPWVWARVAGDLLDAATLAPELTARNPQRKVAMAATAFVAGAALVDLYCALSETQRTRRERQMQLPDQYQPQYPSRSRSESQLQPRQAP